MVLRPNSFEDTYKNIIINEENGAEMRVVGKLEEDRTIKDFLIVQKERDRKIIDIYSTIEEEDSITIWFEKAIKKIENKKRK